uniref:VP11 n=1 Tax=viral metagenome TaxID=1070528 RepID=A0A2V0RB06_9ZZZZ
MDGHNWAAFEETLTRIKHSCYAMHALYRRRYLISRERMVYYDVPIIVLSAITSVFIAGAEAWLGKSVVQIVTCVMSLTVGILGALKKFFKIDENRESCLETYKDMFRLFCELSMMLDQPPASRGVDPQKYSTELSNRYSEVMDRAIVLEDNRTLENPIYNDRKPLDPTIRKKFSRSFTKLPPVPNSSRESSLTIDDIEEQY